MMQVSVRIRLRCSIAAEPTVHHFDSLQAEDGYTPFDLLLHALKSLSLSYNDIDWRPPTMRDAEGAILGTAETFSPISDGVTYEFAGAKRVVYKRVSCFDLFAQMHKLRDSLFFSGL